MARAKKNSQLTTKAVKELQAANVEQLYNDNDIEYVIYVRKSTEDQSGERQAQSIADQIERCVNYAKENNLTIKKKPPKFEFETQEELEFEDKDKDPKNRRIYQETRHLYIIKERMSGSTLGRPKRNKLIEKIRK